MYWIHRPIIERIERLCVNLLIMNTGTPVFPGLVRNFRLLN